MPNFDTKHYTICRFIVAKYYGMQELTCKLERLCLFEVELWAPLELVEKQKGVLTGNAIAWDSIGLSSAFSADVFHQ